MWNVPRLRDALVGLVRYRVQGKSRDFIYARRLSSSPNFNKVVLTHRPIYTRAMYDCTLSRPYTESYKEKKIFLNSFYLLIVQRRSIYRIPFVHLACIP